MGFGPLIVIMFYNKKYIKENDEQSKKITQGNLIVAIDIANPI